MRENLVITWPPVRLYVRPAPAYKPMSNVIFSTTTLTWITEKELEREKKRRRISLEEKHVSDTHTFSQRMSTVHFIAEYS